MTNSRQKGARVERQIAAWLREMGFLEARRGQQFAGGPDSPDVIVPELPNLRIEVKARAKWPPNTQLGKWLERAEHDAGLRARAVLVVVTRYVSPVIVHREITDAGSSIVATLQASAAVARELLLDLNNYPSLTPAHVGTHT